MQCKNVTKTECTFSSFYRKKLEGMLQNDDNKNEFNCDQVAQAEVN